MYMNISLLMLKPRNFYQITLLSFQMIRYLMFIFLSIFLFRYIHSAFITNIKYNRQLLTSNMSLTAYYDILPSYLIKLQNVFSNEYVTSLQGLYVNSNDHQRKSSVTLLYCQKSTPCVFYSIIIPTSKKSIFEALHLSTPFKSNDFDNLKTDDTLLLKNRSTSKDMLIVFTTCNHLQTTILSLKYLDRAMFNNADMVIIDDFSTDGTVDYLISHGYHVIQKSSPLGLTDSWNRGYSLAISLGYKYLIFANNDILVPVGALEIMMEELRYQAMILPTTTLKGAGHNPLQAIHLNHNLSDSLNDYFNNPRNVLSIQSYLSRKWKEFKRKNGNKNMTLIPSIVYSKYPKFNGFFFGINLQKIQPLAYDFPFLLFSNHTIIVGQEDELAKRMFKIGMIPMIAKYVFIYHFKSVTVSLPNILESKSKIESKSTSSSNLSLFLLSSNQSHQASKTSTNSKSLISRPRKDVRENLYRYHNITTNVYFDNKTFMNYTKVKQVDDDISSYPSIDSNQVIVIGFAVSDPKSSPGAGDIYTAYEMGNSLSKIYRNVEYTLLSRGNQWYNVTLLNQLDILITLLDQYDLGKLLSALDINSKSVKPSLIKVAWIRNWFHRWLSHPYIGNYDLLLVSSNLAKIFYSQYDRDYGFRTICVKHCPTVTLKSSSSNNHSNNQSYENILKISLGNTRRKGIPIEILRIATNPDRFYLKAFKPVESVPHDIVFTGSYHNKSRNLLNFDLNLLNIVNLKSILIGSGWDKANISQSWRNISIGHLPYSILPEVYRSTKIVLDDANHVTAPWGSVNSRVFDAIASGTLVLSNGIHGGYDAFEGLLPTFSSNDELKHLIEYYLKNLTAYESLVTRLRTMVLSKHSYDIRANELVSYLEQFGISFDQSKMNSTDYKSFQFTQSASELPTITVLITNFTTIIDDNSSVRMKENRSGLSNRRRIKFHLSDTTIESTSSNHSSSTENKTKRNMISTDAINKMEMNKIGVCIGIRMMNSQRHSLEILIKSLILQHVRSVFRNRIQLNIFFINTENNDPKNPMKSYVDNLNRAAKDMMEHYFQSDHQENGNNRNKNDDNSNNSRYSYTNIHFLHNNSSNNLVRIYQVYDSLALTRNNRNIFYGYDDTDILLEFMVLHFPNSVEIENNRRSYHKKPNGFQSNESRLCDWIMLTNGDNIYNSAWFDAIGELLLNQNVDMIGWDFITHHLRAHNSRKLSKQQQISIDMKRGFIDLGSVIIRSNLYHAKSTTERDVNHEMIRFMPDSVFTKDMFARDYFTISILLKRSRKNGVKLLHRTLMFHQ